MPGEGAITEEAGEGEFHRGGQTQTAGYRFPRVCEAVILCGGLTLALILSPRVTTAAAIVLVGLFVRARRFVLSAVKVHLRLPTSVRLTVVTELSEVWVQTAARVIEWLPKLSE